MKKYFPILMLCLSTIVFSQETKDYNDQTLVLYNNEDWENLIVIAQEAIEKDLSSYEIDYRLAIALFNTKNYYDSAEQFENIIKKYDNKNELILEYLYYAYLFSGRQQDAILISKDFPFHLQQKIGIKNSEFFDFFDFEGGLKMSNEKDLGIENLTYINGGFGQKFGYRVKLHHVFSSLSQNYIDLDYTQREYYGNIKILAAKGLTLIPAYHYINTIDNNQNTRWGNYPITPTQNIDQKTQLFHFAIKKQWNRYSITPNIIYFYMNNSELGIKTKLQYGLNMGYAIKATHDKLWIGLGGDFISSSTENDFIWNVKAYYQFNPKMYLNLKYLNANTSDFSVENAMYYYNSISTLVDNFSTTFGYNFTSKFSWYLNYQFENAKDLNYNISFNYNTFITGIKIDL